MPEATPDGAPVRLPSYDPSDYDLQVRRCPQTCCASFTLEDLDGVEQSIKWWAEQESAPERGETLLGMLIPLESVNSRGFTRHTCVFYDDATSTCTNFLNRPDFCVDTPVPACGGCGICGLIDAGKLDDPRGEPSYTPPPQVPVNSQDRTRREAAMA